MKSYQFCDNGKRNSLSKEHQNTLYKRSANAPDVVAERGTFTAWSGKDVPQDGGKLPARPGLVFRVHTLDGGVFHRLRLNNPGKLPKYMQPKGHANRLDVHPRQHERIKQPGGMRYRTEGEKKVDAGVSHDMLMVGTSGVFNGQRDKGATLLDDWDYLPVEGEQYSILYDSDIETNPMVQLAADREARLLKERGAEVFITLLPPAPDGSKQGLDDFFANGGTVKEIELLTRPYDSVDMGAVRLTRDEKLRNVVEDLERTFWATEWKGMGGHSARDVYLKLAEAARRNGKVVGDGVRVVKAQGPLALEAKVSSRTLWKALNKLEEWGLVYRDNEGREREKAGAFVLRAKVSHYGGEGRTEGADSQGTSERVPGDLHLRAPRLRWSQPKFTPKRGTVSGTRQVRGSKAAEPRERIERLGKIRCAILDALDVAGGTATLQEVADALHRKRARDLRRRNLPMLEKAGIIAVDGDTVSLTDNWRQALNGERELTEEIDSLVVMTYGTDPMTGEPLIAHLNKAGADTLQLRRYKLKSKAFREQRRGQYPASEHWTNNPDADGVIEDLMPVDVEPEEAPPEPEVSPLAAAIRDYLDRNPQDACQPPGWIGTTLWGFDLYPRTTPRDVRAAIEELGGERFLRERLEMAREVVA